MKCGRLSAVLLAIRIHKATGISDEELTWLVDKGFAVVILDADFQTQKAEADKYEATSASFEQKRQELSDLIAEYDTLEDKLSSSLRCWWVGKEQIAAERQQLKEKGAAYQACEKEVDRLSKENCRLSNLSSRLARYAPCNGNWAKVTPAGMFLQKHLSAEELNEVQYELQIEALLMQALSEPVLSQKYSY